MGQPLLSVLIPTLSSRHAKFLGLMAVLLPQCEADGRAEVVALHNDGEKPLAEYRQALLEDARGRWVAFADDDDMVSGDYVAAITEALAGDPDVVAFRCWLYEDGVRQERECLTGIQYGRWHDTADHYIRDVIHLLPVRAPIAKGADFRLEDEGGGMEDWSYVSQIRPLLRTQVTVDRVLYHYRHSGQDSVQTGLAPHAYAPRPAIESPAFRWHPWSNG